MKILVGILLTIAVASTADQTQPQLADEASLKKQKAVLDLLLGITFDLPSEGFADSNIDIFKHPEFFTNPDALSKFENYYNSWFLPKDKVLSFFCPFSKKQTLSLFELFFSAKDFDSFHKVAVWARAHVNPSMFYYAFRHALENRFDTQGIIIPPFYETFPYYYVPAETMMKLSKARLQGTKQAAFYFNNTGEEDFYHYDMFGGLLGPTANFHSEDVLGYFREDVGLNLWYINNFFRSPSWLSNEFNQSSSKQGENFYYMHQQLLARYTLERITNGLPSVEILEWDKPISSGYNPRLVHHTGAPFFMRPDHYNPHEHNSFDVDKARLYEHRLMDGIDNGHLNNVKIEDDVDILGKTMLGSKYGVGKQYYGAYYFAALKALGFAVKTDNDREFIGGALSSKVTVVRDPAFYNFLHRLVGLFQVHKSHMKPYSTNETIYPEVEIKSVEVDKLVTFFDEFEVETSTAFVPSPWANYMESKYLARQKRLDHKPFNYKVTVESQVDGDWTVRVFLGPKKDGEGRPLTMEQSRLAFIELDQFSVKVKKGENVFKRNSKESPLYSKDPEGFRSLYSRLEQAVEGKKPFYTAESKKWGMPHRFQLPRGWKNGLECRLFVIMTPGRDDNRALGFPFDRPIDGSTFTQPKINAQFKDVLIYHKDHDEMNRVSTEEDQH